MASAVCLKKKLQAEKPGGGVYCYMIMKKNFLKPTNIYFNNLCSV